MTKTSNKYVQISVEWLEDLALMAKELHLPVSVFDMDKVNIEQLGKLSALLGHIRAVSHLIDLSERFDK